MSAASRILITGGAGFIGARLAAVAAAAGHEVHVAMRPGSDDSRLDGLGERVERHRFDMRDDAALRHCLAGLRPHRIFHLAATPRRPQRPGFEDAHEFVRDDLDGLVLLLRLAAGLPQPPAAIVRAGSIAEYGAAPLPHDEGTREEPVTIYGAGLLAAARFAAALQPRLPFPVATARLALVFGPMQSPDYLIPMLVSHCLAGGGSIVRRPDDRRDLIFVDDAADGLMAMGCGPAVRPGILNIASGFAPPMREVAREIVDLTGADPASVAFDDDGPASGAAHLCCSGERARDLLGWHPRTSLREGLARTIDWHRRSPGAAGPAALDHLSRAGV